jgi:hypothetical protein
MRTSRSAWLLLMAGSSLISSAGCNESSSGACTDQVDGDIYNLRIYNCTRGEVTVRVNDRDVGTVSAYDPDTEVCGVTDLGSFPQCSVGVVQAFGNSTISQTINWSADAMNLNANGCWVVGTLEDPSVTDATLPSVDTPASPECKYLEVEWDE